MTPCPGFRRSGPPRAGRVLEGPGGAIDLPTGLPIRLVSAPMAAEAAARWTPLLGVATHHERTAEGGGGVCVDAWLTRDWLGRWHERRLLVEGHGEPAAALGVGVLPTSLPMPPPGTLGVTRVDDVGEWLGLAARARQDGLVPVHESSIAYLSSASPAEWPPLLVGVPCVHRPRVPDHRLHDWLRWQGRVSLLVGTPALPHAPSPGPAAPPSPVAAGLQDASSAARIRQLRRAWAALAAAPPFPSITWIPSSIEGRDPMTHLELLDVSTQIEEVRRDEEALVVACRAARAHTRADHTAIVAARDAAPRVVASDGPPQESSLAWPQLCQDDGPGQLVSSSGWHLAVRHELDDGGRVWMCGRWPTREHAAGVCELLSVFARLVAPRVPMPAPRAAAGPPGLEETLVGESTVMQDVRAQIALAARAPFPVLIRGESGCGKELAARAIHALGARRHRRCAAINCAALPDELIESELFGHVRGAFTGAATDRAGLFDEADGGTLFLDEVGELGARAQAKLLRVLQDGEVRRVGENHARRVDVRVIAATNVSLEEAVRRGTFRADLFYRLDVVRVRMPALRERREDIPVLARHFWHDCTARVGSRARLEGRVVDALTRYEWPGNVRQLQNTLAALAVRVPARGRVGLDDLPPELRRPGGDPCHAGRGGLDAARREFEATYVRDALTRAGGRPSRAARDLGVTRQGLSKLVRRLGLDEEGPGSRLP